MKQETFIIDGIIINNIMYEDSDFRNSTEKDQIINICSSCEKLNNNTCSLCNCIIDVLISLKNNHCPINKW